MMDILNKIWLFIAPAVIFGFGVAVYNQFQGKPMGGFFAAWASAVGGILAFGFLCVLGYQLLAHP